MPSILPILRLSEAPEILELNEEVADLRQMVDAATPAPAITLFTVAGSAAPELEIGRALSNAALAWASTSTAAGAVTQQLKIGAADPFIPPSGSPYTAAGPFTAATDFRLTITDALGKDATLTRTLAMKSARFYGKTTKLPGEAWSDAEVLALTKQLATTGSGDVSFNPTFANERFVFIQPWAWPIGATVKFGQSEILGFADQQQDVTTVPAAGANPGFTGSYRIRVGTIPYTGNPGGITFHV